jgi:hypothetical protein
MTFSAVGWGERVGVMGRCGVTHHFPLPVSLLHTLRDLL